MLALWQSSYQTGHPQIDTEHQSMFELVNKLADAVSQKNTQEQVESILNELINHTSEHFQAEEDLVKDLSYRRLTIHRAAHHNVLYLLSKVSKKLVGDSSYLTVEVVQSIKDALVKHIVEEDVPMAQFLNLKAKA